MSKSRRIKMNLGIGLGNAKQEDYQDLPDDWDDMSVEDQQNYLEEVARDFASNYVDVSAWVEEVI